MLLLLFWACFGVILYVYLGYPLFTFAAAILFDRRVRRTSHTPRISILIPAYNEEAHIRETLENKLKVTYPSDRLEIIVVSDGSTDRTDDIVREFICRGVRLIRQHPRQGKTAGLNLAVREASGEILVFSDANSLFHPDAVASLTANFADPSVGYVTGQLRYGCRIPSSVNEGCSLYMRYENALRVAETRLGSIVGVNGGVDAVRRCLYRPMRADQLPDFVLPLSIVEQGFRVVYDTEALSAEDALTETYDEYRMRLRVARRALAALSEYRHLLNPVTHGVYALQLLSHKVLRYFMPIFLLGLYAASTILATRNTLFALFFGLQTLFYLTALLALLVNPKGSIARALRIPLYFCLVNAASAHAIVASLFGRSPLITWQPRKS